ncbi:MAG TPA: HlyD family secretion protein [Verrucomicrobiae bacterium]|jgi:membrane fusion protein (multidrug efflux system)|nr:HlyD family secretion protein [Verrucomicrobiae bacterium]
MSQGEEESENKKDSEKEKRPDQKKSDEKKGESDDKEKKEEDKKPKKPPIYKKPAFIITVSIVAVVLIVGVIILWLILRQYVSTDDAYIDGHVSQVSPRVSALVIALHIDDNQFVHQGDLLVELDPTDYQIALEQAQAEDASSKGQLAQAQAQIETAKASVVQTKAEVDAAEVLHENTVRDLERYRDVDARARTKQQLDNAATAEKNTAAQLEQAKARENSADASVKSAEASVKAAEGNLQMAEANEKRAATNLSYCKIFAPCDGRVTQRTVERGNYVSPGQALLMLVDPNVWVTANFKETQLTLMRPGQPVTIEVDAFPKNKWHGHVDSIQAGSGARFEILPAENATGNFVKVVQRVPVKIVFDHGANTNDAPMLSPGLSVDPRVKVR